MFRIWHQGLLLLQGAVTVIAMSIPAMFTLLTLLRIESENAVDRKKMQWQVLEVLQERSLMQQNQPLSMPVEQLSVSQSVAPICSRSNAF